MIHGIIDSRTKRETVLETAAITDRGLVRNSNEDSIAVLSGDHDSTGLGFPMLIVADGLGGHNAGDHASRMVTTELPRLFYGAPAGNEIDALVSAITQVNTSVYNASRKLPELRGMGSTLVMCVVVHRYLIWANVGDSRGYIFRDGSIIHKTRDHTLREESLGLGPSGERMRFSHVLTQAIGARPNVSPYIGINRIEKGDIILLCSDGLSDAVTNEEIIEVVQHEQVDDAARRLVGIAHGRGGEDNISVVLSRVLQVSDSTAISLHVEDLDRYIVLKSPSGPLASQRKSPSTNPMW